MSLYKLLALAGLLWLTITIFHFRAPSVRDNEDLTKVLLVLEVFLSEQVSKDAQNEQNEIEKMSASTFLWKHSVFTVLNPES